MSVETAGDVVEDRETSVESDAVCELIQYKPSVNFRAIRPFPHPEGHRHHGSRLLHGSSAGIPPPIGQPRPCADNEPRGRPGLLQPLPS